jgi:hypothetical protein
MTAIRRVFRRFMEGFVSWLAFGPNREVQPETIMQHCIAKHGEVQGVVVANPIATQRGCRPTDPFVS